MCASRAGSEVFSIRLSSRCIQRGAIDRRSVEPSETGLRLLHDLLHGPVARPCEALDHLLKRLPRFVDLVQSLQTIPAIGESLCNNVLKARLTEAAKPLQEIVVTLKTFLVFSDIGEINTFVQQT